MKATFALIALVLVGCTDPAAVMHTLTVTGSGGMYNAAATSDPPGIACTGPDTMCSAQFEDGVHVHLTVTGGGTSSCAFIGCGLNPRKLDVYCTDFVMDADYGAYMSCVNP